MSYFVQISQYMRGVSGGMHGRSNQWGAIQMQLHLGLWGRLLWKPKADYGHYTLTEKRDALVLSTLL